MPPRTRTHRFSPWCTFRAASFAPVGSGKGLLLLGLPFEPSTRGGRLVETHVLGLPNAPDRAVIACMAGDYIGYLVTREEYAAQMYEGGSCWFGRNTMRWVTDNVGDLLSQPQPEKKYATAWFSSEPKKIAANVKVPAGPIGLGSVTDHWTLDKPAISTGPDGTPWLTIGGMWTAAASPTPHGRADQPAWMRLLLRQGPTGTPQLARLASNLPANDKCGWILVFRELTPGEDFVRWRWQYHGPLPPGWKGLQVSFDVLSTLDGVRPHKPGKKWLKIP